MFSDKLYRTELVMNKSGLQYTVQTYFEVLRTVNGLIYKIPHTMVIGDSYEQEVRELFIPQSTIPEYDKIKRGHFYLMQQDSLEIMESCRSNELGFSIGAYHVAQAIHSYVIEIIKNDEGGERVKVAV